MIGLYQVIIRKIQTEAIVKELEPLKSRRIAEKIEAGVNINLNHDEYYTEIVDVLCPRCKQHALHPEEVMNALSRKDNETYICNDCAWKEAQEEGLEV